MLVSQEMKVEREEPQSWREKKRKRSSIGEYVLPSNIKKVLDEIVLLERDGRSEFVDEKSIFKFKETSLIKPGRKKRNCAVLRGIPNSHVEIQDQQLKQQSIYVSSKLIKQARPDCSGNESSNIFNFKNMTPEGSPVEVKLIFPPSPNSTMSASPPSSYSPFRRRGIDQGLVWEVNCFLEFIYVYFLCFTY